MIVPARSIVSPARIEAVIRADIPPRNLGSRGHRVLGAHQKLALIVLHYHEGRALSLDFLAERLDLSPSATWRALKALREAGLITSRFGPRRGVTGGPGMVYAIDWKRLGELRGAGKPPEH